MAFIPQPGSIPISIPVWWLTTLFLIMEDSKLHQNMRSPDVSGRYNPCESYPFPWEDKIGLRRQPTAPQTNRTGTFYKCGIICAVMNCGQWGCSSRWVLKLIKTQCWSMLILTSLQLFKRKNSCSVPCLVPYVALNILKCHHLNLAPKLIEINTSAARKTSEGVCRPRHKIGTLMSHSSVKPWKMNWRSLGSKSIFYRNTMDVIYIYIYTMYIYIYILEYFGLYEVIPYQCWWLFYWL